MASNQEELVTDERYLLVPPATQRERGRHSPATYGAIEDFGSGSGASNDRAGQGDRDGEDEPVEDMTRAEGRRFGDDGSPEEDGRSSAPRNGNDNGEGGSDDGSIGALTRRLRCVFSTITWPIVPLGTVVALALLWVLYAASTMDVKSCSHPLHWYAVASLALVVYVPNHSLVRSRLFHYSRERDGPIRPTRVRMYDQLFHTVSLLYVYGGVSLISNCRNDLVADSDLSDPTNSLTETADPLNTCAATCPNLYQALSVYISVLEMFTFALVLPLLFLPVVYLWFLRRATAEAESITQIQDRHDAIMSTGGGITAAEILESLENVKLVSRTSEGEEPGNEDSVWLLSSSSSTSTPALSTRLSGDVKECCICMTDFPISNGTDVEDGLPIQCMPTADEQGNNDETQTVQMGVVRTRCGHLFHKDCLAGWVGGRWRLSQQSGTNRINARGQARQTCCPLCREDLRP